MAYDLLVGVTSWEWAKDEIHGYKSVPSKLGLLRYLYNERYPGFEYHIRTNILRDMGYSGTPYADLKFGYSPNYIKSENKYDIDTYKEYRDDDLKVGKWDIGRNHFDVDISAKVKKYRDQDLQKYI